MKQIKPQSADVLADAHIFAQHIVAALDCLGESSAMNQIFSASEGNELYRKAPHFYRTAYFAMQYRFHMEVAKLFDERSDAKKFLQFKNDVCRESFIGRETQERYRQVYKAAEQDICELIERRNKIYAHSDAKYFNEPEVFLKGHPVDFGRLKVLLETMLTICNEIIRSESTEGTPSLYSTYNNDDFVKLFGYETKSEKELEAWLGGKA